MTHPDQSPTLGSPGMVGRFRGQQTNIIDLVDVYINLGRPRKKACGKNEVCSSHLLSPHSFSIVAWSMPFIISLSLSGVFM